MTALELTEEDCVRNIVGDDSLRTKAEDGRIITIAEKNRIRTSRRGQDQNYTAEGDRI